MSKARGQKAVEAPRDVPYVTWEDDRGKALAMHQAGEALRRVEPVVRNHGHALTIASDIYYNIAPNNVSVRDGFSRRDYEDFRFQEATPQRPHDIMRACMHAYESNGIVRNIIDLMSDFAVQGLTIVHPNERIERFYKEWFRRVNGLDRSERFLNVLYRCGNVIIKRQTARLGVRDEQHLRRAVAGPDLQVEPPLPLRRREVPWRYTFLNPLTVEVMADQLAPFIGPAAYQYAVRIPDMMARIVRAPRNRAEQTALEKLPPALLRSIRAGEKMVPLDTDKVVVAHYKKDDWSAWAKPMLYPILKDLNMLEKMKLADLAALDGAISCIRVWKLGSLEHKIMPSENVIFRLAQMLTSNVGGGVMDLVWGPDIELVETSTDVHKFLGESKYAPVLNAIFQGLGIPPSLTGNANPGGFTNNFISLKTLVERLEYGRAVLVAFWEQEIRLVQRAMGFRFPASLLFDKLLTDEAAEKQLLLHLWDRDLVSDEAIQAAFNLAPDIEEVRTRRDMRRRKMKLKPPKASPFHSPEHDFTLEKIFAQTGQVTPAQVGLELQDRAPGEKTALEQRLDSKQQDLERGTHPAQQPEKPTGVSGQGRPRLSRDSGPRKQKTVKPRRTAHASFVSSLAWAEDAQARITRAVQPAFLRAVGKKNLRELTEEEASAFEAVKFGLLCQLGLGQPFDDSTLAEHLSRPLAVPVGIKKLLRATVARYVEDNGREPSVETMRRFQASVYALWAGEYGEEEGGPAGDRVPPLSRTDAEPTAKP